jgi:hypothetical protein
MPRSPAPDECEYIGIVFRERQFNPEAIMDHATCVAGPCIPTGERKFPDHQRLGVPMPCISCDPASASLWRRGFAPVGAYYISEIGTLGVDLGACQQR